MIVFVEVAQFPSVRAPSPGCYVGCLCAFGAGNQVGHCVCRLDARVSSQRNDPVHHTLKEAEARTRCD